MAQEQDEVLLERIKQLESENKQLRKPGKSYMARLVTKAEHFVDGLFALLPPILFGTFILSIVALPIAGAILQKDTGNFYPEYNVMRDHIIRQEVEWGEDKIVWRGEGTPEQVADKVREFKEAWKKAHE